MLFEPHVFYRLLGKGAKRDAAVSAGLAYPKWGMKPYARLLVCIAKKRQSVSAIIDGHEMARPAFVSFG